MQSMLGLIHVHAMVCFRCVSCLTDAYSRLLMEQLGTVTSTASPTAGACEPGKSSDIFLVLTGAFGVYYLCVQSLL